jgi:hypothetical protein
MNGGFGGAGDTKSAAEISSCQTVSKSAPLGFSLANSTKVGNAADRIRPLLSWPNRFSRKDRYKGWR